MQNRIMEWINVLVEENRALLESRKRTNTAAAGNQSSKSTHLDVPALPPAAVVLGGPMNLSTPYFDLEYVHTSNFARDARYCCSADHCLSHKNEQWKAGNAFHVELEEVVTEKSSFHCSLACSGGDKEKFFDVDRHDSSDDEGDDDDVNVNVDADMLVVDLHSHY
ncbi:hypothetical protein BGZ58_003629 [Dissophora ornata]|nr:hypothetical protein BGZ58_003629 [Dissophora ornata]